MNPSQPALILDKSQLQKSIYELFLNGTKAVIQQANTYIMEAESDPNFLPFLIDIFEAETSLPMKNQIFLVFKNALKRKLKTNLDPKIKIPIIEKLVLYLQHFKSTGALEKSIENSVLDVVETEFPFYKALLLFMKAGFEQISALMNENPQNLMSQENLAFLKLVRNIFKRKRKTIKHQPKLADPQFRDLFESVLQTSFSILELILNNFEGALNLQPEGSLGLFLHLSTLNDDIVLMVLQYLHPDSGLLDIFKTIIEKMFQKCSKVVQQLMDPKQLSLKIKELLQKNLKAILYSFSQLQNALPFFFQPSLDNYLQLIKYILENNSAFSDEKILKSGLICFLRFLKTFAYFADSQTYSKSLGKNEKSVNEKVQKQQTVSQGISSMFSDQTIEIFLFLFLQNILIREFNKQKDEENYENLIEIDNEIVLEDTTNEFENSVYNLTLVTVENLFLRFPQSCLEKMNNLTNQLISIKSADQIEKPIQDGIFAMLGVVPKVFMRLKIEKNPCEIINILKVLEFLKSNLTSDVLYARRFASLTLKWVSVLDDNVLKSIADLIYQILTNFNNQLIQYESIKCLHQILKAKNVQLNFQEVLMNITPIILSIIEKFNNPSIICPLIEFLNFLIEKTQYFCPHILAAAIQNPSFKKLIDNESELLRDAICEMFKSLVVSFSSKEQLLNILVVAIDYVDQSFQINQHSQNKDQYEGGILRLWLLIIKEYSSEIPSITNSLKSLFAKYRNKILGWTKESDLDLVIDILEENVLLSASDENLQNYKWLLDFLERKYEFANTLSHPDSILSLKISILSLTATLILKLLNQNQEININLFEKMLMLMLGDHLRPKWLENAKKSHGFRTSLMTLINRFLIKNPSFVAEILQRNGKLEDFGASWIYLMKEISSENACKINIIAVNSSILFLEKCQSFLQHFDDFIENILSNYASCLKYDQKNDENILRKCDLIKLTDRLGVISKRKESLRKTNVFSEVEIKVLFPNFLQELLFTKGYVKLLTRQATLEKLKIHGFML